MTLRNRLAAVAVTAPLVMATALFAPAAAQAQPVDPCPQMRVQVQYLWNMYHWYGAFYGSSHPATVQAGQVASDAADYYTGMCV